MKVWLFNFRILFSKIFLPTLVTHSIKGDYLLLFTKGTRGLFREWCWRKGFLCI